MADVLTTDGLTVLPPTLDAVPTFSSATSSDIDFATDGLTPAAPTLDAVPTLTLSSFVSFSVTDVAASVSLEPPTAAETGAITLPSTSLTVAPPVLGTPVYARSRLLGTPPNLTVAHPLFDTPAMNQNRHFVGVAVTVAVPTLASPVLHQKHVLAPLGITIPTVGVGTGTLHQKHALAATALTVAVPVLGTPTLVPTGSTTSVNLSPAVALTVAVPTFGTPAISQGHVLSSSGLTSGAPVFATPALHQHHVLSGTDLTTGAPILGQPSSLANLQFTATNLTVAVPSLTSPSILESSGAIDIAMEQRLSMRGTVFDFLLQNNDMVSDQDTLSLAARVALGTDRLSDADEILPDPDSTDRRGWWGDLDAQEIWDGWPIGTRNWLLTRSKITPAPSEEGDTVERARRYTFEALQPFVDRRIASSVEVDARRVGLERIEVRAVMFRGPLPEIDLRFQVLWDGIEG